MRIIYVASGIRVPGAHGGSTHTWEVARGLTQLGHDVHVIAQQPAPRFARWLWPQSATLDGIHIHYVDLPKALSLLAYPHIARLVRKLHPDALIERYYNLAGAGMLAAKRAAVPSLLEVNALIVDPPAVRKRRLDDRLGQPLQRWAVAQCRMAARVVTPLHTTVPAQIERQKIVELPWGANVQQFSPDQVAGSRLALRTKLGIPPDRRIAVFLGSFRAWHGVHDLLDAGVQLWEAGEHLQILLIGDGPQRAAVERRIGRWHAHVTFVGSVPNTEVPALLALADVGMAPFNTAPHPALQAAGFFWSPLKMYEYMAMQLPVVTADIPPLNTIIREGQEGALFREGDVPDLAAAIQRVLHAPDRAEMGRRARQRVVECYSWEQHCRELERLLNAMQEERRGR